MKVCVIIPVFNEQDFIKKSVESLIGHVKDSLFGFDNRYETMMYVPFSKNDDTKFELKACFATFFLFLALVSFLFA